MKFTEKIRLKFASLVTGSSVSKGDKVAAAAAIPKKIIGFLTDMSSFDEMDENEIYQQLYVWEPEIGGSIDRMSTMVGQSFKYFYHREANTQPTVVVDSLTQDVTADTTQGGTGSSESTSSIGEQMAADANAMAEGLHVRQWFEVFSEVLLIYGNLYLERKDKYTLDILPNLVVSLIEKSSQLGQLPENYKTVLTQANILVLNEDDEEIRRTINKDNFIHVKYKATPTYYKDAMGRNTFGMYAVSPLHRVIIPVWWKRQTTIIDIMWRWRNVPREHHQVSAEMFSMDKYVGDTNSRRTQATKDATSFLTTYVDTISSQVPDQGYATLDTVKIGMVENKGSNYMQTNQLIDQINTQIWSALNMPKSMISGESHSSYASELVISNYVEQKVLQLSNKIKPVILNNIRERLLAINPAYPVDELDVKLELEVAASQLETFRQLAIMVQSGIFTETELREFAGYTRLQEDQREELVGNTLPDSATTIPGTTPVTPETPQSSAQHSTDTGKAISNNAESIKKAK